MKLWPFIQSRLLSTVNCWVVFPKLLVEGTELFTDSSKVYQILSAASRMCRLATPKRNWRNIMLGWRYKLFWLMCELAGFCRWAKPISTCDISATVWSWKLSFGFNVAVYVCQLIVKFERCRCCWWRMVDSGVKFVVVLLWYCCSTLRWDISTTIRAI